MAGSIQNLVLNAVYFHLPNNNDDTRFNYLLEQASLVDQNPTANQVEQAVRQIRQYWRPTQKQVDALRIVVGRQRPNNFQGPSFLTGAGALEFANFHRELIALQLVVRIANPNLMLQGTHSLCGPVAFLIGLAHQDPAMYVQYVIDLATTRQGSLTIGNARSLNVHVRRKSNILQKPTDHAEIPEADYVALASLRNSESILPYRSKFTNRMLQGATTNGELCKWMEKAGFQHCQDHSHLGNPAWSLALGGEGRVRANLQLAIQRLAANPPYTVLMSGAQGSNLAKKALSDNYLDTGFTKIFGAHIVLLRGVTIGAAGVQFDIVSWGRETDAANLVTIPWDVVRSTYRGFVCGQP